MRFEWPFVFDPRNQWYFNHVFIIAILREEMSRKEKNKFEKIELENSLILDATEKNN